MADEYTYKNVNNDEEVTYPQPNRRLERLSNWELIAAPQVPDPEPVTVVVPEPEPAVVDVPLRNASRAEWAEYAEQRGGDADRVAGLKRDELIDEFGPKE